MQSDQAVYSWLVNFKFHPDILKTDNGIQFNFKNESWTNTFNKLSKLMIKNLNYITDFEKKGIRRVEMKWGLLYNTSLKRILLK